MIHSILKTIATAAAFVACAITLLAALACIADAILQSFPPAPLMEIGSPEFIEFYAPRP